MSFKREGDDEALLHNLKMRRVGELLSEHIPDDEAKLLSNGRLTCLICSHRPIFDTCTVLANHRKGKKHIVELGKYLQHKRELDLKKLKSEHEQYLLANETLNREKTKNNTFSRKPILCVPKIQTVKESSKVSPETHSKSPHMPSPASQVRHYLKGVQRKRALQKTVEKCRENYMVQFPPLTEKSGCQPTSVSINVPDKKVTESHNTVKELQWKMSGWIKTSEGKWVKDPDAEFDSDEEPPDESV